MEIRYDPGDMSKAWVFHKGRFVCVAEDARALAARATEKDCRDRNRVRQERHAAFKAYMEPIAKAAEEPDMYLAYLEEQRAASVQAASIAGGRPRPIRTLLPREAQALRATDMRASRMGRRHVKYDPFE